MTDWQVADLTFVVTVAHVHERRFEAVRDTWATRAAEVVYLAGTADPERGWQGYDTGDDYASVPHRLHALIMDYKQRGLFAQGSKWWVFVDDDTWVFPERLATTLSACPDDDAPLMAGYFQPIPEVDLQKSTRGDPDAFRNLWRIIGGVAMIFNREALSAMAAYASENPDYPMNLHGDVTLACLYNRVSANRQTIHTTPCDADGLATRAHYADTAITAHYVDPESMRRIFDAWYG